MLRSVFGSAFICIEIKDSRSIDESYTILHVLSYSHSEYWIQRLLGSYFFYI